jgi:hypothetical protein
MSVFGSFQGKLGGAALFVRTKLPCAYRALKDTTNNKNSIYKRG